MLRIKSQHKAQYSVRFRISPSSYILIKKQHLAKHQKQYRSLHHIYVTIVDIWTERVLKNNNTNEEKKACLLCKERQGGTWPDYRGLIHIVKWGRKGKRQWCGCNSFWDHSCSWKSSVFRSRISRLWMFGSLGGWFKKLNRWRVLCLMKLKFILIMTCAMLGYGDLESPGLWRLGLLWRPRQLLHFNLNQ
jgi:hypothetical protein